MTDGHKCPGPECTKRVPSHMLMCSRHWYQVPPRIRREVWRAYRSGTLEEHSEAMRAAIESITP